MALTYAEWLEQFPDGETPEQVVDRLIAEQPDLDAEQLAAIAALVVSATRSDAGRLPSAGPDPGGSRRPTRTGRSTAGANDPGRC